VSEAIKSLIRDHDMKPGERLPQEPDLIGAFGVSKGTIREALKILETQGLIQMRTAQAYHRRHMRIAHPRD